MMPIEAQNHNVMLNVQHPAQTEDTIDHQQSQDIIQGASINTPTTLLPPHSIIPKQAEPGNPRRNHHIESRNSFEKFTGPFSPFYSTYSAQSAAPGFDTDFPPPSPPSTVTSILPLTSQNLREFTKQSDESASMATPTKSSNTTSQLSSHIQDVRQILRINGMPVQADGVLDQYPDVKRIAEDLIEKPRHSPGPTKEHLASVQKVRQHNASRNETTFVNKFFGVFHPKSRHVQTWRGDLNVPGDWEARDWEEDGLDEIDDQLMRAGSVPEMTNLSKAQKLILNELPHISKPKPDILYGYDPESFTAEEDSINALYKKIASVSEGIAHPFFDIEAKTKGDPEEAVNMACTGGAALVQAHRKLKDLAIPPPENSTNVTPYADTSTMAYSMVITPNFATIYVHWALVTGKQVIYHMHCIGSYGIAIAKNLRECRAAANNVLDWGLGERRKAINLSLEQIYKNREKTAEKTDSQGKGNDVSLDKVDGTDQSPAKKKQRTG